MKINTKNFGLNTSFGLGNSSIGIKVDDTAISINDEIDFSVNSNGNPMPSIFKTSLKISQGADYQNLSAESYTSICINPLQLALVAALLYFSDGAIIPLLPEMGRSLGIA